MDAADVVRGIFEALNRRDVDTAAQRFVHPDLELYTVLLETETDVFRGVQGFRQWFELQIAAFPDWHGEVEAAREGPGHVLAVTRVEGHGAGSGVPVAQRFWHLSRFRDEKVVWWRFFRDERDALEFAGAG